MGRVAALGEWRSITMASGEQFAMIPGILKMLRWCVDSWTVGVQTKSEVVANMVQAVELSGWMTLHALVVNVISQSARTEDLEYITVIIVRMLVLSAQVRGSHSLAIPSSFMTHLFTVDIMKCMMS